LTERISLIRKHIKQQGEVKLADLEAMFPHVSSMTLRRDLEKLEAQGELVRTRGGAKSVESITRLKEELYAKRATEHVREKADIARKALALLKEGCTVFLDSGTTVSALARVIEDRKLFVVTAAPNIALECVVYPDVSVFLTGGRLNRDNLTLSGVASAAFLGNINIDIAFVCASGYTFQNAFTCGSYDESVLKRKVISKAAKVVMLIDSSKFGNSMPFTFAKPSDLDCLITDGGAREEYIREFVRNNVEVI